MLRYRLRTLLIVLAILPPLIAYVWPRTSGPVPIATVRPGETAEVDLIQVNTVVQPSAPIPVFKQVLFWSRHPDGELHVRTWRLVIPAKNMQFKNSGGADWECAWTESGIERRVRAPAFQETKSPDDLEMLDRQKLPKPDRIP